VNVPVEVRQEYGEQNITNPEETAEVDVVSELDPKTVRVRYKGREFPISKEHLTVAALENRIQAVDARKILSELVAQKDWSGRKRVLEAYSTEQLRELENYLDEKGIQDPVIRTAITAVLTKKTGETLFDEQSKSKGEQSKNKLADELSRQTGMFIDDCMNKITELSKKLSKKRTAEMDKYTYEDAMSDLRYNVEMIRNLLYKIEDGKDYIGELEYHIKQLRRIFEDADMSGLTDKNGNIIPPEE